MATDREIIRQITLELSKVISLWYGTEAQLSGNPPDRVYRKYSMMLIYRLIRADACPVRLCVKIPHEEWMGTLDEMIASEHLRKVARAEAEMLFAVEKAVVSSGNPDLTAIHCLGFLQEFNAVVMEFLQMTSFKDRYLTSGSRGIKKPLSSELARSSRLAGEWLKIFHQIHEDQEAQSLMEPPNGFALEEILVLPADLSGTAAERVRKKLRACYQQFQAYSVPVTLLHQDFNFSNVFITEDGKIGGFDPNYWDYGAIYKDLARFITDPVTRLNRVTGYGGGDPEYLDQLEAGFLAGYGGSINEHVLAFFCAAAVMEKWHQTHQRFRQKALGRFRVVEKIYNWMLGVYYYSLIERYLSRGLPDAD